MKKYRLQTDGNSCGPIAIYNTLVYFGYNDISYRKIRYDCNPHPVYGTYYTPFSEALCKWIPNDIDIKYVHQPEKSVVFDHLDSGGVAIICEHWTNNRYFGQHYFVVFKIQDRTYEAINWFTGKQPTLITKRQLGSSLIRNMDELKCSDKWCGTINDVEYPNVWLLKRV